MRKFLIILIFLLAMTGCSGGQENKVSEEVIKSVVVKDINPVMYSDELTLSGNIVPTNTVKLSFKIPGVVSGVLVNEGDYVKKGQAIANLDQQDYSIRVRAARAELEADRLQIETEIPAKINQAKAQYDLTKASYNRVKNLYEKNAVAESQLDEITAKLIVDENTYKQALDAKEIAEKKLQMAEASLDLENSNIDDTTIYSPADGVVLKKIVEAGETISAGYSIVVIGQVDKVWAEVGVPDGNINTLQKGQKADVYIYGIDTYFEGKIDEITQLADSKTRTFPVKILINNPNNELKPGMISRVSISMSNSEKMLIPISSVIQSPAGAVVYTYSEKSQAVSKRVIETGEIIKDQIEVKKGLKSGDKIVTEGQALIRDGDKVAAKGISK